MWVALRQEWAQRRRDGRDGTRISRFRWRWNGGELSALQRVVVGIARWDGVGLSVECLVLAVRSPPSETAKQQMQKYENQVSVDVDVDRPSRINEN